MYAIYLMERGEQLPETVRFAGITPEKGARMELLGYKGKLRWKQEGDEVVVTLPAAARKKRWADAVAIKIK